ncbi:Lamin-like protein [Acorus gramineus]|uniref:Lamin-like protein n=1 Tax=Acorus gramineus TaxID=55184 RepID=A0AAV9AIQ9_ACOGR|nr:Lamin-like protein [Acorus gramineus]
MASNRIFVVLAILATILPSISLATEHIVGDDDGWRIGFDYSKWAEGKTFQVGDTLVFNYNNAIHNVFKVSGPQFQACYVPVAMANNSLTSGHDIVVLKTPGRKWYICGAEGHCGLGQKLVIDVSPVMLSPVEAPAPAPTGWPRSNI